MIEDYVQISLLPQQMSVEDSLQIEDVEATIETTAEAMVFSQIIFTVLLSVSLK